jgi:hypothetical protein
VDIPRYSTLIVLVELKLTDHGAFFVAKSFQGSVGGTIADGHHEQFTFTITVSFLYRIHTRTVVLIVKSSL